MSNFLGMRVNDGFTDLYLNITKGSVVGQNDNEYWCNFDMTINNDIVNLTINKECLTNYDLEEIKKYLKQAVDGKIDETISYESDLSTYFEFVFNQTSLEWKINLFFGGSDYYCLVLSKSEIEKLYDYLTSLELN